MTDWPDEFKVVDDDPESPTYGQEIPFVMSDQDIVTIYNSVEATPLFATPSPPFEIRQRSLAYTAGLSRQVIFFLFEIENISDQVPGVEPFTLEDAWMGYDSDMDIGDEFTENRPGFFQLMF